jgi:acyl dehydratase
MNVSKLENITFDEISIGQTATYTKTVTAQDLALFAVVSGDANPVHLDEEYASQTMFKGRIAHGMLTAGLISAALAMELPGPGTIYLGQSMRFQRPVRIGDVITVELKVLEKDDEKKFVKIETTALNQDGKPVVTGTADVMAPTEKVVIENPTLPSVSVN